MANSILKILITSSSDKVPLIDCIKRALSCERIEVVCADTDGSAASKYFCSMFWHIDFDKQENVEYVLGECIKLKIDIIIPTRDGELLFWAKNREIFAKNGIVVMVAEYDAINCCLDKYLFYKKLKEFDMPIIPTFASVREIGAELLNENSLWVVKNRFGAGSRSILLKISTAELCSLGGARMSEAIIQPYICGKEFSVDSYASKASKIAHCVVRERTKIKHGESQVTKVVANEVLRLLSIQLVSRLCVWFHSVTQWIVDDETGMCYVLECNPRFGGASTLSVSHGLNSFMWFLLEVNGSQIPQNPSFDDKIRTLIRVKQDFMSE